MCRKYRDNTLISGLDNIFNNRPKAKLLISELYDAGELLLFGGSVRYLYECNYQVLPRDIDIVIKTSYNDLSPFLRSVNYSKNRFGGYKFEVDGLLFDLWTFSSTWAIKNKFVYADKPEDLTKTVFLNHDAIVYNLNKYEVYDGGYKESKDLKMLDIVLAENPFPTLNILRALVLMKTKEFTFSHNLKKYIYNWKKGFSTECALIKNILDVQETHYGIEYLNSSDIKNMIF